MSVELETQAPDWLSERPGVLAPTQPGGRGGFLTDVIVELGFCTTAEVDDAVRLGRESGKLPTGLLVERGQLNRSELARAISERNGLPFVDLSQFEIDDSAQLLIERSAALRYRALPIAFAPDGALVVALADPLDSLAVSDIAMITKSELLPVVAAADEIEAVVEGLPATPPRSLAIFEELSDPSALGETDVAAGAAAPHLAVVPPAPDVSRLETERARLEAELERERIARGELEARLADAEQRATGVADGVSESENRVVSAENLLNVAQQRAAALERRFNEAEARAEQAEARASEAEARASAAAAANAALDQKFGDTPPE